MTAVKVHGVHPIEAREPVHLIQIELSTDSDIIDWCTFTQPTEGRDSSYWQVPYDEQPVPNYPGHWCFFFHYLDASRPLSSIAGPLSLPAETPVPPHLQFIRYEEP